MLKNKRGTSEVLGALLIASIVISMSTVWLTFEASHATRRTMSVVNIIRAAERKQKQLLSLTYYYYDENDGYLKLYIYNYGDEVSTPNRIITNREVKFEIRDPNTGNPIDSRIKPKTLVELAIEETYIPSGKDFFNLVLFTEEGGIYSWRIVVST